MKRYLNMVIILVSLYISSVNAQVFNIKDFGAIPDDKTINTLSIQAAIDSCARSGGGTVYVPLGIFVTGTIELKSNINLYLESGSELKGSPYITDYKYYKAPDFNSSAHYGIIYTYNATNVSITGQGAINGNDTVFFDWTKAKSIEWGGVQNTRQKENFRKVLSGIGDGPVVPLERPRQMVIFSECTNVLIRDIQLLKSPFWTLHLADCDGVVVFGLKVWASMETPNSDGIDITSCNNVMISDCDIRTGDDAIVVAGYSHHYELPGYNNLIHPSGNITITNCNLQSRSSGIRIGYIDQNSVKNIHISNINITNSNRGIGIFVRGEGSIENVTISQISIETRLHTGDWWGNAEPIHISAVRGNPDGPIGKIKNVTFRDITCTGENGILLFGSKESMIENVRFENLQLNLVDSRLNDVAGGNIDLRGSYGDVSLFVSDISAIYAQYVKDLSFDNINIHWIDINEDYFTHGIHIRNFETIELSGIKITSTPANKGLTDMLFEDGKTFKTDLNSANYTVKNVK